MTVHASEDASGHMCHSQTPELQLPYLSQHWLTAAMLPSNSCGGVLSMMAEIFSLLTHT